MKEIIFLTGAAFLVFVTGCVEMQIALRPKAIRGQPCMVSPKLKVLQVLNDGVLAYLCPMNYPSSYEDAFDACIVKGDLVYMSVPAKTNDYVDNQKVTLAKNQCFVGDGTYSYIRHDGVKATIRNVKILEEESNSADK